MKLRLLGVQCASLIVTLLLSSPLFAATRQWTNNGGTGDGLWSTASNWSPAGVPGPGDDVQIGTDQTAGNVTMNAVTATVNSIAISNPHGTSPVLELKNAASLTIDAASTVGTGATLLVNNATISGAGALTISGALQWTGGSLSGGALTLNSGATASITGAANHTYLSRALTNAGTITFGSMSANFYVYTGGSIANSGVIDITADKDIFVAGTGPFNIVNNSGGVIKKSAGTGNANIRAAVTNNTGGTISALAGTLTLYGGGSSTGAFTTVGGASASTLSFEAGDFTLDQGSTFTGAGKVWIGGKVIVPTGASVTMPNLQMSSSWSRLDGGGTLTISATLDWSAGVMYGPGTTVIDTGATATIGAASYKYLESARTLSIKGTALHSDSADAFYVANGSIINIANGATFNITGTASLHASGAAGSVVNGGTFQKTGGANTSVIYVPVTSSGLISVTSGNLALQHNVTINGGTLHTGTTSRIDVTSGTTTFAAAASFTGTGSLRLAGGNVHVPSGVSLSVAKVILDYSSSHWGGSGSATIADLTWNGGILGLPGDPGGSVVIGTAAALTNVTYKYVHYGVTLTNNGTITYTGSHYTLGIHNGATLINNGTFDLQGDGGFFSSGSPAPAFTNNGTFNKTIGTTSVGLQVPFNNSETGTLHVATGRVDLTNGGTSNGIFTAASGASIRISSTYTLGSTADLSGIEGTFEITGTTVVPSGTVTIANLLLSNGALGGAGTVNLTGAPVWNGGQMGHSSYPGGTTVVPDGTTLTLSGTTTSMVVSDSRTLTNNGTIHYTSTYGAFYVYATFNNAALFDIKTDLDVHTSGSASFANTGTIQKSSGTDVTFINPLLATTDGTVAASAGTLGLNGGGTYTGATFTAGTGATIMFGGGTHTVDATSSFGGAGTYAFASGTVTVDGTYNVAATVITHGTFTLDGTGTTGTFTQSAGLLSGTGTLTINGAATWSGGTMAGSGQTILAAGKTLSMPDNVTYKYLDTRTFTNNGTIEYTGSTGYYLQIYNNGTLVNAGTLDVKTDTQLYGYSGGTITNSGTFKKTAGTGSAVITPVVNNSGTVLSTSGTLALNGGGTHTNGSFTATSPGTVAFKNGTHTISGTGTIGGTGTIAFLGGTTTVTVPFSPAATLVAGGTAILDATGATDTFTLTSGTLGGSGTLTINQSGSWAAGSMTGSGATVIAAGKSMTLADSGYKYLETRTFTNNGTITYPGTSGHYLQIYNNGTLNNPGTLQLTGDNQIYGYSGATINNSGTITKTAGTATTAIAAVVNNTGTVSATTGTIALNGGGTHNNGTFSATSPATIAFGGGTHAMTGTGSLTGTGTMAFTGANATVSVGYNPGAITVTGGTVLFDDNGTTGTLTLMSGTLSGGGTLTATNGGTWSGGSMAGSGATVIPAGKTLAITDYSYKGLDTRTLLNKGTITYSPVNHYLQIYNNGLLNNQGTLNLTSDQQIYAYAGGTINNSGTIAKTGGTGVLNLSPIVNSSGTVSASAGTLSLNGGGTHTNGSFVASGTGTVAFGGGTHTIAGTGSLSGIGTFAFTGGSATIGVPYNVGTVRISGGTATFNTNGTAGTLNMTVSGGTLGGSGIFTVSGAANWAGGTMSGSGSTIISAGQTLDLTGANSKNLESRTLVNNGTMLYPGTGSYHLQVYNNGTINNIGTFTLATDIVLYGYNGGTINNSGSIHKTSGTGELNIYPALNNTGTLTVSSGTLRLRGDGTHTGLFVANTDTVLDFAAGAHTTSAASSLTGAGTYRFSGGTATVNGSYASPIDITHGTLTLNTNGTISTFGQSAGTLNGTGTLTVTGSATWAGGTMSGTGQTVFASGSTVSMSGSNYATLSNRSLTNKGSLTYNPAYYLQIDSTTLVNEGTFDLKNDTLIYAYGTNPAINNNGGTFKKTGGTAVQQFYGSLLNSGTVLLSSGTLQVSGSYEQSAGLTQLQNATLKTATVALNGGSLTGDGTVMGAVVSDAIVAPGGASAAGTLTVTGSYTQTATGDLNIELGGTTAGTQYDRLIVNGAAALDGDLNLSAIDEFAPASGNTFQVLTFGSRTNSSDFAAKNGLSMPGGTSLIPQYSSTDLQLTANNVQADLALTAAAVTGTIYNGQSFTYNLSVANGGGSNASGVTVTVTLPGNVSFVSASPAVCSGAPLTCNLGNIANGASAPLAITVAANGTGSAQLNATVTASQGDPVTSNNSASASVTIQPAANVGVAITDSPDPVEAGTNVVYTSVVTNHGPNSASGVSLAASPHASLTFVSNSGGCTTAFPCSIGTLASGQSVTVTSTYAVGAAAPTSISTTVTVSSTSPADLTSANNSATAATTVAQDADLRIVKTGPASVSPNAATSVTYSITVTNNGPSSATGVTIADPPVDGLTFVSATGPCQAFPCNIGSLTSGQSVTTNATYSISGGAGTTVTNTATVSATTPDAVTNNNSSSATTTISSCAATSITAPQSVAAGANANASATSFNGATYSWTVTNGALVSGQGSSSIVFTAGPSGSVTLSVAITAGSCSSNPSATVPIASTADVAITKTGPANVAPSTSATVVYTIAARNNGPSPAAGVTITDPTPAGLTFVSATGACTSFPCSLGTLAANQSVSTQVTYSVSAAVGMTVTNTATIATTTTESNTSNNSSSVSTTVSNCPNPAITAPSFVQRNSTGNPASVSAVSGATYAWAVTNGTITEGQGTRKIAFTAGASGEVTLRVTVSGGACSATPSIEIPIVVEADLAVAKSGPANVSAGEQSNITYSIVVTNNGPATADDVELSDPTPNGLRFVSATGSCVAFPCSLGSLEAGQSITVEATYELTASAGTSVTNTATVFASTVDNSSFNDSSSVTTTIVACPTPVIAAPAVVDANTGGHHASVTPVNGASYAWSVTNGAVAAGQGTSSITFNAGANGEVTLSVTVTSGACVTTATHVATISTPAECPVAAPQLVSPADGAQNVASPVTFQWNAVAGATGYELWLTAGGTSTLAGGTTGLSLVTAVPSGNVTWHVVARYAAGCEPRASARRTLTVASGDNCAQNGRPQLLGPAANATVTSPVTFNWTAVPGASGYRLWLEANGTAAQDVGTTAGTTLTATPPSGPVVAYVDALFSGCAPTRSDRVSFTVAAPDPCASRTSAALLAPANGSVVSASAVEFRWQPVPGASAYRVWASIDGRAPSVLGTATAETSLTARLPNGAIVWWVESLFQGCASTESARSNFTIPAAQNCGTATAEPIAPANGSTTSSAAVTFSWTAVPNAAAYELWLSLGSGTPTLIATTSGTTATYNVSAGKLQWFVRAIVERCAPRDSRVSRFTYEPPAACPQRQRPVTIEPLDKTTLSSPVNFSWNAPAGATRYELFAARGNSTPALLASTTEPAVRNVRLENGNHRWFVRAHFENGCPTLDSAEQKLTIVPEPAACAPLTAPVISAPGQVSSGIELLIQWSPVPGATSYELQLASNAHFANAEAISTSGTQHAFTRTNTGTEALAVYARVRAVDAQCSVPAMSAFGPPAALYILPAASSEAGAPLTATGTATFAVPIGAELAGQTFTVSVQEPWLTVEPLSGVVPAGGMTLTATADLGQLGAGANLAAIRLTFSPANASNVGAQSTTVSTPTLSISKVSPVVPAPRTTPPPDALIIPAVAHADGINSKFQSDVRVTNTSPELIQYEVTFTPSGAGIEAGRQTTFSIDPGQTVALDDVLRTWFGTGGESITGTLEVRPLTETASSTSGAPQLGGLADLTTFASSRTFNVTANGTFGQYIPAIPFANFVGSPASLSDPLSVLSLQQIAQSDRYRTNLGIVEGSGEPASLLVSVFGEAGRKLTEFPLELAGGQHMQLNGFLRQHGITTLSDGRVEVSVVSETGKVTAYASVLDNATNDPLLVSPVTLTETGSTKWVMPGVADLNTGFANWQTDMRIFNAGEEEVMAKLTYYSLNGGEPKSTTVTIPAGEVRQFDRALSSVFGLANDGGAVHIATGTPARLIATARTYNQTAGGTYGQFISAVTPEGSAALGTRPLQLLQVEESTRFRSNIGLAEVTGNPVTVEVSIVPPNTKFTAIAEVHLAANEFRQLSSLLRASGLTDTYNARVTVRVIEGNGRVTAYASVIDQLTNDPTYVPAQ